MENRWWPHKLTVYLTTLDYLDTSIVVILGYLNHLYNINLFVAIDIKNKQVYYVCLIYHKLSSEVWALFSHPIRILTDHRNLALLVSQLQFICILGCITKIYIPRKGWYKGSDWPDNNIQANWNAAPAANKI